MKIRSCMKAIALVAALTGAICAFADGVVNAADSVVATTGTLAANGNNWTASSLVYIAPTGNDSLNRSETGWYAGIRRYWALSYTGNLIKNYTGTQANNGKVKASFSDNAGRTVNEFSVYKSAVIGSHDNAPQGSGIKNDFGGTYMDTTDWNVWVTPEIMKAVSEKGEDYVATLTIGGETYTITIPRTLELVDDKNVKWWPEPECGDPVSLEEAEITLSATEIIVRGETIGVEVSQVTVDKVPLTEGTDYTVDDSSVFQASAVGEYTVKLNGIGNYTGSATATWKIIEPKGEFAADAMSIKNGDPAYGSIAAETPRRLDITDTTKLVYKNDDLGERWEAAVEIRWPHEVTASEWHLLQQVATSVRYTDAAHATVAYSGEEVAYGDEILDGEWDWLSATTGNASYYIIKSIISREEVKYEYFDMLTWTVPIYAADVASAIEGGAKHLEFSINCASVAWGDETEGDVYGLKETEFVVDLKLANVFLLDDEGTQVYPHHDHDWRYGLSEDGTTLSAKCCAEGCFLSQTTGDLLISIESKDAKNPDYADGHYRDGKPAEALLNGADEFAHTGCAIGEVRYETESGAEIESAPVEPGRYAAFAVVTADGSQGEEGSWTIRVGGIEILAGEASVNGVHVKDASEYLERATGDAMQIAAGKSYTAQKAYKTPARYGVLNLYCGVKTYDLAGFTVTAAVDQPFFENNGRLVITDTSEGAEGVVAANEASAEDTIIVNTGTLTIEGGTFRGSIVNDGGTVSITGGRFSVKPDASFIAEGYDLVRRGKLWSVEKHEHDYRIVVVGGRLAIATCFNVFAEDSLQVSHCDSRQLVGILGIRKSFTGLTKGVPALSVDYDRKEHPAEFYAINMTTLNAVITDTSLLGLIGDVVENVDFANIAETDVLGILSALAQNDGFADVLSNILGIYVEADDFEKLTGCKLGKVEYALDGESLDGVPVEPGNYAATMTITLPGGGERAVKGSYRINEKELPIETEGHSGHFWTFDVDGAKVTANCPGNLLAGIKCNASPMSLELVPSAEGGRKVYDAKPLDVAVSNLNTFVINTEANVGDVVYATADGEELDGAPVEPGEYTAKITVSSGTIIGALLKHTATLPLVIEEKEQEREFPVKGWTKHVGSGDESLVVGDEVFYYPVTLSWPYMIEQIVLTPRFTDPGRARITVSTAENAFTGAELLEGAGEQYGLAAEAGEFFRIKKFRNQTYMKSVYWNVPFTFQEIDAARAAGEKEIVRTITLEGKCGEDDMAGLKPATYTIILDVENLVVNDDEGRQIYPFHNHSWTAENTGATLTLTCGTEDCPLSPGLVAELSVGFEKKQYDALPATAALTGADAMRIHADVTFGGIMYVELGEDEAEYPLGGTAPSVPGRYYATVDYSDGAAIVGSLVAEFEIQPLDAAGMVVYFGDPRRLFFYSGEEQGPDVAVVWYGPVPLRYGVDFEIEGDFRATEVGEYTFAVVGKGNFDGRQEFAWRIAEPVRPFAPDALKIPGGPFAPRWGEIGEDGTSAVVVASSNLVYDATGERWVAPLTIDWPYANIDGLLVTPPHYTDPRHAKVETDCGEAYLVSSFFKRPLALLPEEYVVKVLWTPSFTMNDVKTAFDAGEEELVFEITVGANAWTFDPFGLRKTTYRLVVPLKGLILDDGDEETVVDWYWIEYLGNGATSGEMAIERRLVIAQARLTECAYRKKGFNLLGWSRDAAAKGLAGLDFADMQVVSDEFTVGVTNTIYAVWTKDIVLSGDISGEDWKTPKSVVAWGVGSSEADAVNGRVFGSVAPWRYVVVVPSKGAYDVAVVAEGDGGETTTTTVLVIGEPDPEVGRKSEPVISDTNGVSSTVDNSGAGDYPAVVGGLDDIARKVSGEKESKIEVRFTVTEMPAAPSTVGYSKIRQEVPSGCVKPLDFTLGRYVDGVLAEKLHDLADFGGLVSVVMKFKAKGRRNLKVVRYHEDTEGDASTGLVYVLPEGMSNANKEGECFEADDDTGELLIRGAKLSTYALLWDGAEVSSKSLVWHVDWLSGMYVPEIELEVKDGMGWASTVHSMSFLLEKRGGVQLWNAKTNKAVTDIVTIDGVKFYRVKLKDRFAANGIDGPDSAVWGAAWYDANWVNAALSEVLLSAPAYWPSNPKDVPAIDNLVAFVAYESCDCEGYAKVGANKKLMSALSTVVRSSAPAPLSVAGVNASIAFGADVTSGSKPYCRLVDFTVADEAISGTVEVGAGRVKGSLGVNATVAILGAKSLGGGFTKIATAKCDSEGRFSVKPPGGYKFFKVELSYSSIAK